MLRELVVILHLDSEGVLIGIVVKIDEAVVQKESRVALLTVRVVNLLTTLDVLEGLNDETLAVVSVRPARLTGSLVVQHICVGDESISLHSLDIDAEDATGNHHSNLGVLLKGELFILGHLCANGVVVLLDVADFFTDLVLERTALEPGSLLLSVKNGEVVESLGQNIDVLVKERRILPALLHNVSGKEGVLR